jgi:phenylacetate-CoA ligase
MAQRTSLTNSTDLVRDFGPTLAMTQWLSPEELQASQAPLVSRLLLHARTTTKFYKDRLDVDFSSPASIQKIWSDIPILTRREAVMNRFKLTSRKTPSDSGPVSEGRTSGSTGAPFAFKKSVAVDIVGAALTERMLNWWSVDGRKPFAQIASDTARQAPPPDGRTTYGWHSGHARGIKHIVGSSVDIDTHLKWLMARRAAYFGAYPSLLKELALYVRKRGIELKFELLLSFGAVLDERTRELCRDAFGAQVADTYGAQETGHIAAQCRECGEYHISTEAAVVEVLRADGSLASPGEIGRVVITPLYNYAMPLIRYELGDLAEVGSTPSRCGRGLPTLRRILGRTRNLFRFRDGTAVWPIFGSLLGTFIAPKQFQVVQTDFDHIEIRYVPENTDRPIDLMALTQRIRAVLRQPVEVVVRSVDEIGRSPSGKYEEYISLVSPD